MYIYESHLGGLYSSEFAIPYEDRYCDTCNDVNMEIGCVSNSKELRKLLKDDVFYNDDYIEEFIQEMFPGEA